MTNAALKHRHSCVGCPAPGLHFCSCGATSSTGQQWDPAPASFQVGKSDAELYPDVPVSETMTARADELARKIGCRPAVAEMLLRAEDQIKKLVSESELLRNQRDDAEQAMSQAYFLITGLAPQWSERWGYAEALDEIDAAQQGLRGLADSRVMTNREGFDPDCSVCCDPVESCHLHASQTQVFQDDVRDLLLALGLSDHARSVSAHRVLQDEVLPAIQSLVRGGSAPECGSVALAVDPSRSTPKNKAV